MHLAGRCASEFLADDLCGYGRGCSKASPLPRHSQRSCIIGIDWRRESQPAPITSSARSHAFCGCRRRAYRHDGHRSPTATFDTGPSCARSGVAAGFGTMNEHFTYIGHKHGWGDEIPFGISAADQRHHLYLIGKTGSGKRRCYATSSCSTSPPATASASLTRTATLPKNCSIASRRVVRMTSFIFIPATSTSPSDSTRSLMSRRTSGTLSPAASSARSKASGGIRGGRAWNTSSTMPSPRCSIARTLPCLA